MDAAILLRRLRAVRVSAAVAVRAAHGVHRAQARVLARVAARAIVRVQAGAGTGTVIPPAKVTAAAPGTSIRLVRTAETIPPSRNPAKAQEVLRVLLSIQQPLGREKKRPANPISQNTKIHKILARFNEMILIVEERRR